MVGSTTAVGQNSFVSFSIDPMISSCRADGALNTG